MQNEYTGVYENEQGEQRIITVEENQLYSQRGRNPKFLIKAYQPDRFFFDNALLTLEFVRNKEGEVEKLITHSREGNMVWMKTDNPVAIQTEIKVDPTILEKYVGEYAIAPEFTFVVTREQDRVFLQASGQEMFEMFAETESKFFLKTNDAQLEFVKGIGGCNQSHFETRRKDDGCKEDKMKKQQAMGNMQLIRGSITELSIIQEFESEFTEF